MSILEQLQLGDYVQLNGAGRDLWKVVQATPGSEDHVLNPGVSIQDHYYLLPDGGRAVCLRHRRQLVITTN
jgi:hypothetical protein